jgi:hypothetical protein
MAAPEFQPQTQKLVDFARSVGIAVTKCELPQPTFLPGIDIRRGALFIDAARLSFPGDILHEAGHIAVTAPELRHGDDFAPDGGEEMAAIAWSWAALRALDLDPAVVFHPAGYKGAAESILCNFSAGRYFGVPLLACWGMTRDPHFDAPGAGPPFPAMRRWLR